MAGADKHFEIDDTKTFAQNLDAFRTAIEATDPVLAAVVVGELKGLIAGTGSNPAAWDALLAAAEKQDDDKKASASSGPTSPNAEGQS